MCSTQLKETLILFRVDFDRRIASNYFCLRAIRHFISVLAYTLYIYFYDQYRIHACAAHSSRRVSLMRSLSRSFVYSFIHSDRSIVHTYAHCTRVLLFLFPAKNRTNRVRSQRRTDPMVQAIADARTVPLMKSPNIISDTPSGETVKQFNVDDHSFGHSIRHNRDNHESSTSLICCYNSFSKSKNNQNNCVQERLSQWDAFSVQNQKSKNGIASTVDRSDSRRICSPCVCCCYIKCQSSRAAAIVASAKAAPAPVPHTFPLISTTSNPIILSNNNSLYKNNNFENDIQLSDGAPSLSSPSSLPSSDRSVCDSRNCDSSIPAGQRCRKNGEPNLKKAICCSSKLRGTEQTAKLLTVGVPTPDQRTPLCDKLSFDACCDSHRTSAHEQVPVECNQTQSRASAPSTPQRTFFLKCRYIDAASRRLTSSKSNVHSEKFSAPVKSVNILANDSANDSANDFANESIVKAQRHQQNIDSDTRGLKLAHRSSATKQQIDLLRSHFEDVAITSLDQASPRHVSNFPQLVLSPSRSDRGAPSPRNTDHKYERPLTENNVSKATAFE